MEIKCIPVGEMQSNTYVVYDTESKNGIIFDAGDDAKCILSFVENENLKIKYIVLTHGHFDHIMAVTDLKNALPEAEICIYKSENCFLNDKSLNLSNFTLCDFSVPKADILLDNGDELDIGNNVVFKTVHTPGHTSGSCCFLCDNILISGDTLFKESIGRCDFPTGNADEEKNSVINILYMLDDSTVVYPGHGEPTTIGYEKKNNYFFRI